MAAPITKTDAYLTIRARRIKIGKTFNISASAIDQHPTKIPAKIPNRTCTAPDAKDAEANDTAYGAKE